LWETIFFHEFKYKGAILKSKIWNQQTSGEEAFKHVVYSNTPNLCLYSPHFFLPSDAHIELSWFVGIFHMYSWPLRLFELFLHF